MSLHGLGPHGLRTTRRLLAAVSGHCTPHDACQDIGDAGTATAPAVPRTLHRRSVSASGRGFSSSTSTTQVIAGRRQLWLIENKGTESAERKAGGSRLAVGNSTVGHACGDAVDPSADTFAFTTSPPPPPAPPLGRLADLFVSASHTATKATPLHNPRAQDQHHHHQQKKQHQHEHQQSHQHHQQHQQQQEQKKGTLQERLAAILRNSAKECNTGIAVELALSDDPTLQAKGLSKFRQGISKGEPALVYNLALCYEQGRCGVSRDMETARHCYKEAAEMGHRESQYNLGVIYSKTGKRRAACHLFRQAHEAGLPEASLAWAMCLMYGQQPKELAKARKILSKLSKDGDEVAAKLLVQTSVVTKKREPLLRTMTA